MFCFVRVSDNKHVHNDGPVNGPGALCQRIGTTLSTWTHLNMQVRAIKTCSQQKPVLEILVARPAPGVLNVKTMFGVSINSNYHM